MEYNIFENADDKQKAIDALAILEKSEGWKYISKALDININKYTDDLRSTEFEVMREVDRLQDKITHLSSLLDLPQDIISEAKGSPQMPEEDIY